MAYQCTVKQGNLLNETSATFIVNASNTKMLLGSGVSMAFKRHCGIELQEEMTDKFNRLDCILKKGDVVATSSGNAKNFKYALHAAIMDYNQGVRGLDKLPTISDIENILINIESYLIWYRQEKSSKNIKIVLPLLGCGVGKLNKVNIINLYKRFFSREVEFKCEVIIYGYNIKDYALLKKNLLHFQKEVWLYQK